MSQPFAQSRVLSRADNIPAAKLDDGMLVIDRAAGYCYSMNPTSTRIWELLSEPTPVSSICDRLCEDFDVNRDTCMADLLAILARMEEAGLVR